jgi:DNA-binding transcriptional ArsR family regulator
VDNPGDEIPDIYYIESLEQVRAVADVLRLRILDHLAREPLTVTQLGERLGVTPAKAHYHVGELVRVGLVRLVETRENRGILEKYYRAAGRDIHIAEGVLRRIPPDETIAATSAFLQVLTRGMLDAMWRGLEAAVPEEHVAASFLAGSYWMTDEEMKETVRQISEILKPYEDPRGVPGEHERMLALLSYPLLGAPPAAAAEPAAAEQAPTALAPAHTALARQRAIAAGILSYTRADLERLVAEGRLLDISALGAVTFADDVTPELADRAIGRFRFKGVLHASPEVREVLKRKEKEA